MLVAVNILIFHNPNTATINVIVVSMLIFLEVEPKFIKYLYVYNIHNKYENMDIINFYHLNTPKKELFFNFLKDANKETSQPAYVNMWDDDWLNKTNTLPYLLEKTDRFNNTGLYNVLFDGDTVVACSGIYSSAFCKDLAIAGSRTWINKNYRNKSIARDMLLPVERAWAIENKFKAIAICFNDYNKNMTKIWNRIRFGEKRTPRQSHHIFYNGVNELEFPVTIQYTKQWVMYEKLDPSFDFDWSTIK
jgi:hypothetical protein